MDPLTLLVNTQTPLLQFPGSGGRGAPTRDQELDLQDLEEGADYRFSPGGVTRMVYPLLKRLESEKVCKDVHWVSLNPSAPEVVRAGGLTLHNVAIDPERLSAYGKVKDQIWSTVHGTGTDPDSDDLFWTDDYGEYAYYNRVTAEQIRELDREVDFDLFYIHDFQQLAVGHNLATLKPKLFRWHIPFEPRSIPDPWRAQFATFLNSYDVAVVSSDRYRAALKRFGYQGRVVRIYPYVDPAEFRRPPDSEVAEFASRWGILPEHQVVLVVARMDPAKAQDRAIRAVARLRKKFPRLRLILVGNGSFSGTSIGPTATKSGRWRQQLEALAKELGVEDRVVSTGHVPQEGLDCLYERADLTVLPSVREGFGLVVVESWLHERPTVVTSRAGVAELIDDGANGLLFDPDEPEQLAEAIERLLRNRGGIAERMAQAGRVTAARCTIDAAVEAERELLLRTVEA